MKCAKCNEQLKSGHKFCIKCGYAVTAEENGKEHLNFEKYPLTSGAGMTERSQRLIDSFNYDQIIEIWNKGEDINIEQMAIVLELSEKLNQPIPRRLKATIDKLYRPKQVIYRDSPILPITVIIGLLLIGSWFYWFQWRPSDIKKSCAYESRNRSNEQLILQDRYQACLSRNGI